MEFLNKRRLKNDDENFVSYTSIEQEKVENIVDKLFETYIKIAEIDPDYPILRVKEHIHFLKQCVTYLPSTYTCLDSSRPWMCYWICHSLVLLKYQLDNSLKSYIVEFLNKCQNPRGGFGGGPGQTPHLASTYAAVNALCCLNTEEAYKIINREKLKDFLWSIKCKSGAFCLEMDGEVDIRGAYCATVVATITNINNELLFENTVQWIVTCQTYEGGFSGCPGMEAHGGYTFCGVASLVLLNALHLCDIKSLLRWCVNKQTSFEGGFQGRTNKLVDGCYSFWQGSIFPIIHTIMNSTGSGNLKIDEHLFAHIALQEYILICCQHPSGGLVDKPDKPRDIYHTCYTLSGLSISQYLPNGNVDFIGCKDNLLMQVHPLYNLEQNCLENAFNFFFK